MRTLKNKLRDSLNCCDCGFFEVYMVRDEVWAAAGLHWRADCCLAYLERRLKRAGRYSQPPNSTEQALKRPALSDAGL
jgi:hypothetical protein